MTSSAEALIAALIEIESYVGQSGWDQPGRLFALVDSREFVAKEPELAQVLGLAALAENAPEGQLTSIEQDDFSLGDTLGQTLAEISWPAAVRGCALVLERTMLPHDEAVELPEDPIKAAQTVAAHPQHEDIRLIVGALRSEGEPLQHAVARLRSSGDFLSAPDLVPDLETALAATLVQE
ncbi:MAG: PPA1309 family protein [Propionibacteriaceae bacterium]